MQPRPSEPKILKLPNPLGVGGEPGPTGEKGLNPMSPSEWEAVLGAEPRALPLLCPAPVKEHHSGSMQESFEVRLTWVCISLLPLAAGFVILGKFLSQP